MDSKGRSRKRTACRNWKPRLSAVMAFVLTASLILGNVGNIPDIVMAGQGTWKEEFRLHAEDIQKAAEEAIAQGEALQETLAISGKDERLTEEYKKLLAADGSLYEIFPDYEEMQGEADIRLRTFIRLPKDADPASYAINGEEELIFLYVNGGSEPVAVRLNIDGYITGFDTVKPFASEPGGSEPGFAIGGGAGNAGGGSGTGTAAGNAGAAGGTAGNESITESTAPEDSLPASTEGSAEETEGAAGEEDTQETDATAEGSESVETETTEAITESPETLKPTTGSAEGTEAAGTEASGEAGESGESKETEAPAETDKTEETEAPAETDKTEETEAPAETDKTEETEAPKETDQTEETEAPKESEQTEETEAKTLSMSLNQIRKVASTLATPSDAAPSGGTSGGSSSGSQDDSSDSGEPFDAEDAAALQAEEDAFKRVANLDGKLYDLAVIDESMTMRAYVIPFGKIGIDVDDLIEAAHAITYTISQPELAKVVLAPELVRDEAKVTFGICVQEGYQILQVSANGEELEQAPEGSWPTASTSNAARNLASDSNAAKEEILNAVYYTIPSVLEAQNVNILVAKEVTFQAGTLTSDNSGYEVNVSYDAEAQIPEGAKLVVTPVSDSALEYIQNELLGMEEADETSQTYALDIKIVANGLEVQPAAPVQVSIRNLSEEEISEVSVYHFPDTSAESMEEAARDSSPIAAYSLRAFSAASVEECGGEEVAATVEEDEIRFYAEGFSVYTFSLKGTPASTLGEVDPDKGLVIASKTFKGITESEIPSDFYIEVKNGSWSKTLTTKTEGVTKEILEDGIQFEWKISDAPTGSYYAKEYNYEIDGYDVQTDEAPSYEITPGTFTIDTHEITSNKNNVFAVGIEGNMNTIFASSLTGNDGVIVVSEFELSRAQQLAIEKAIVGGEWKSNVYFYSINKNGNGPFEIQGKTVTYNPDTNEMTIGVPGDWNKVKNIQYSITAASTADIPITNTYTPKVVDVSVKKLVTGTFGDTSKKFKFRVTCTEAIESGVGYTLVAGSDNKCAEFELAHDGSITLKGVRKGSALTIEELNKDGYEMTIKVGDTVIYDEVNGGDKNYIIPKDTVGTVMITVINHKDGTPDTGILLDSMPYVIILGAVVAGAAFYFIRKRKKEEEDFE